MINDKVVLLNVFRETIWIVNADGEENGDDFIRLRRVNISLNGLFFGKLHSDPFIYYL